MFGVLFNGEPIGTLSPTGDFKYISFNTEEQCQSFCNNLTNMFNVPVKITPAKIQTREQFYEEQYSKIPVVNEVNTYSRLDFYDGEGEQ